ncbi:MAG: TetR/AcrR family transcriptional regulator [Candidatus Thorarchaeota archaeon]|jgi:AcrR family transcriptional regulator
MRTRDQAKYDSIVKATINLTNKLGFDGISISKIAKKANVSPATIYIYFKNKEDLFTNLYTDIRGKMSQGALEGLEGEMTTEETFKSIWYHSFTFNLKHPEYLAYREQFERTTMMKRIRPEDFELYQTVDSLLKRGIKEKTIKSLPLPILTAFAYFPIITLLNFHHAGIVKMDENQIEQACEIAWNAIHS